MFDSILVFFKENIGESFSIKDISRKFKIEVSVLTKYLEQLERENSLYKDENNKYSIFPNTYCSGEVMRTSDKKFYIVSESGRKIFIEENNLNNAIAFDNVIVEVIQNHKEYDVGIIKKIVKRKNQRVACEIQSINGHKVVIPCNSSFENIKFKIVREKLKYLVDGDRIIFMLPYNEYSHEYRIDNFEILCRSDDPDKDMKTIAANNNFSVTFKETAIEELKKIPEEVRKEDLCSRLDLREELIFTIDGADTKDIDDAISIKLLPNGNYELGVHIAHVSHYIKKTMALFDEAYERGTSLYLLEYVIPMFPHLISNGICSLNENVDRLTRSCIMEIDKKGNVVNYKICKSVIHSKKKMTYENVDKILEENIIPAGYEEFESIIRLMGELSDIITQKRINDGSLNFASDDIKVKLDENGKAIKFINEERHAGGRLIENFMIYANETVAKDICWLSLPFVYRVHNVPSEEIVKDTIKFISGLGFHVNSVSKTDNPKVFQQILASLSKREEFFILSNLLLRCMNRAKYDTKNIGHFGIASEAYTHFTSPIRRFPDLLVHMLLDKYETIYESNEFDIDNLKDLELYLKEACEHASYKERQADIAEREANKFKMVEFMEQYIGDKFEAVITMITSKCIYIRTNDNICGKIKFDDILGDKFVFNPDNSKLIGIDTKIQYCIGNKVIVSAKKVSHEEQEIYFYLEENISKAKTKKKAM